RSYYAQTHHHFPTRRSSDLERIQTHVADHVAEVVLSRPERHNALDLAMFDALIDTGAELAERRDVHAVVLRGDGPSFCSGLDYRSQEHTSELQSRFDIVCRL